MREVMHRLAKDIPSYKFDDTDNLYPVYNNNPLQKHCIDKYNATFYKHWSQRTRQTHIVYHDGYHKRVMKVTLVQAIAYKAISMYFKTSNRTRINKELIEQLYRPATINALIKKGFHPDEALRIVVGVGMPSLLSTSGNSQ